MKYIKLFESFKNPEYLKPVKTNEDIKSIMTGVLLTISSIFPDLLNGATKISKDTSIYTTYKYKNDYESHKKMLLDELYDLDKEYPHECQDIQMMITIMKKESLSDNDINKLYESLLDYIANTSTDDLDDITSDIKDIYFAKDRTEKVNLIRKNIKHLASIKPTVSKSNRFIVCFILLVLALILSYYMVSLYVYHYPKL